MRLPPRPPTPDYSAPRGGQPSGRARPGQLSLLLGASTTVVEFEPPPPGGAGEGGGAVAVTVPAVDGTVVTTGNLDAVTAEAGAVTSLSVAGTSYLQVRGHGARRIM